MISSMRRDSAGRPQGQTVGLGPAWVLLGHVAEALRRLRGPEND